MLGMYRHADEHYKGYFCTNTLPSLVMENE
jgi:hypothetical protein